MLPSAVTVDWKPMAVSLARADEPGPMAMEPEPEAVELPVSPEDTQARVALIVLLQLLVYLGRAEFIGSDS